MVFPDRTEAGRQLAELVAGRGLADPVVLALPRGGVPVGFEVARRLGAPLDVLVARKVGAPRQPELGIGAIAEGGTIVVDHAALASLGVSKAAYDELAEAQRDELERRVRRYRGDRPPVPVTGRDVVLVDDGLATGVTAEAALHDLRRRSPRSIVLAVPVCAAETAARLGNIADDVVYVEAPEPFVAVGRWYDRFDQTTDDEVVALLDRAGAARETAVEIPQADGVTVAGDLAVPGRAAGIVVFAHGSGSSRRSPRNRAVAARLQACGLATLLLDLLTEGEDEEDAKTARMRFDVDLLADRLEGALTWTRAQPSLAHLPLGCFGASTGAAAALIAAAQRPDDVAAVVSRGGRADLAGEHLAAVRAPTLLVVGGSDQEVLRLNEQAADRLVAEHRLEVVPGATHLFEEPGAMDRVAHLAAGWFTTHL